MSFKHIQSQTHCIFSRGAQVELYNDWDEDLTIAQNIDPFIDTLIDFTNESESKRLDGLSLEVKKEVKTIDALAILTHQILSAINNKDPHSFKMCKEDIQKEGWIFNFNGMNLHLLTFAACYSCDHPRQNYDLKNTYFLFQPHHSFSRRRDHTGLIPEYQKEAIRQKFKAANMPYDVSLSKSGLTAYKFVKPQCIGDELIKWWEKAEE